MAGNHMNIFLRFRFHDNNEWTVYGSMINSVKYITNTSTHSGSKYCLYANKFKHGDQMELRG